MDDELRTCRRTGCNEAAAASLSFRYETRQVWVTALGAGRGTRYDLCGRHAETLTVPRGWHRVDERPAPHPRNPRTAKKRSTSTDAARAESAALETQDRYAPLLLELPQLPHPQDGDLSADAVGQLSIPVAEREAVIVSLTELAGARRERETLHS